jgi:hypothetical protein
LKEQEERSLREKDELEEYSAEEMEANSRRTGLRR